MTSSILVIGTCISGFLYSRAELEEIVSTVDAAPAAKTMTEKEQQRLDGPYFGRPAKQKAQWKRERQGRK